MKRTLSMILLIAALLVMPLLPVTAHAEKKNEQRSIAIVFDNSGSMYVRGNMAWCRATYAMEVFAAMMNEGDTLSVYPMNDVEIDGTSYTARSPVTVKGPGEAGFLRKIYTPNSGITPIETIDEAYRGLKNAEGERWLIVLTDGNTFHENNRELKTNTVQKVSERLQTYNQEMNVLYLGIGEEAAMPEGTGNGTYTYFADKATDSNQVLSRLTSMCNMIFGRDTLPDNYRSGDRIDFDLTMGKLIAFVQGENVKNVSITDDAGNPVGKCVSSYQTRFSERGAGNNGGGAVDTSLQGCIVTYENCPAGNYRLSCDGNPTSTELYYEPDVDLVFTFTDSEGNVVDPKLALYEGDYTVSYGLEDVGTGELVQSDLLGSTSYDVCYTVNGEEEQESCTEQKGAFTVHLVAEDNFNAEITAQYLSGYSITKKGEDFGWPDIGLIVAKNQAGQLQIKVEEREEALRLTALEESKPYRVEVLYNGVKLTGVELEACELFWNEGEGALLLKNKLQDGYYEISFAHRDTVNPQNTEVGDFTVSLQAAYTPDKTETAYGSANLKYSIVDDSVSVGVTLQCEKKYYQIKHFTEGAPIFVYLTKNGQPLTDEELEGAILAIETEGIDYEAFPVSGQSVYQIVLKETENVETGSHEITVKALLKDAIGRTVEESDSINIKIGIMSPWVIWGIIILIILTILAIVAFIMTRKVMPRRCQRGTTDFDVDGHEIGGNAKVAYDPRKKVRSLKIESPPDLPVGYSSQTCMIRMTLVPISPRYVRSARRRVEIEKITAPEGVDVVEINSSRYIRDEHNNMVKEASSPTTFGGTTTITLYGTAINSRAKKKNATLVQQIKFK